MYTKEKILDRVLDVDCLLVYKNQIDEDVNSFEVG